ncbi:hypothetical protein Y886_29045 [Xanthomonas hyacinthi DSM 19077]|nr:hypothetical protein Y886_29045 [Xanthomonas hyacinthi DSM 19077]
MMAVPTVANILLMLLPITLAIFIGFLTIGIQMPVVPLHLHEILGMGTLVIGQAQGAYFHVRCSSDR